jgi:hypothetical protein
MLGPALCVVFGTAAWLLLAVAPGQGRSQVSAGPYIVALVVCGALVGVLLGGHPLVTGAALAAPALLTAGWLAPRGDDDGLWLLWFPTIAFAAAAAAGSHPVGVAAWRRFQAAR